jgi:arginine/ornithine N-succinyltransferase beta subunit
VVCDLSKLYYQWEIKWDIKNCNLLCFTELWLNDDTDNIELAEFSMHRQDREATSGKMRGKSVYLSMTAGVQCLILNKS